MILSQSGISPCRPQHGNKTLFIQVQYPCSRNVRCLRIGDILNTEMWDIQSWPHKAGCSWNRTFKVFRMLLYMPRIHRISWRRWRGSDPQALITFCWEQERAWSLKPPHIRHLQQGSRQPLLGALRVLCQGAGEQSVGLHLSRSHTWRRCFTACCISWRMEGQGGEGVHTALSGIHSPASWCLPWEDTGPAAIFHDFIVIRYCPFPWGAGREERG